MRKEKDILGHALRERVETGIKRAHNFARARTFERSQKSLAMLRESFESLALELQNAEKMCDEMIACARQSTDELQEAQREIAQLKPVVMAEMKRERYSAMRLVDEHKPLTNL